MSVPSKVSLSSLSVPSIPSISSWLFDSALDLLRELLLSPRLLMGGMMVLVREKQMLQNSFAKPSSNYRLLSALPSTTLP